MIIHDYSLSEARRKKQYRRHVSREDTYDEDMTHHNYGDAILSDIGEVMKLMASGQDTTLTSDYNAHELDDELRGFRSIHLYPGEKENGPKDVVILYKVHSNDHLVLHGIGNHLLCVSEIPEDTDRQETEAEKKTTELNNCYGRENWGNIQMAKKGVKLLRYGPQLCL